MTLTAEQRTDLRKALINLRKDAQPGVSDVHVNAPIGSTAGFAGPTARALLGKLRLKLPTVVSVSTEQPVGKAATTCDFCDQPATGDTDPPTCADHTSMAVAKAISGLATVVKSAALQFTFSPLYVPNSADAHGEWADPDDLQKAAWGLVRSGDRTINLQHVPGTTAGEWVELATIPWEHEVNLSVPGSDVRKARLPAGTPWMGVVWNDAAWTEVQAGRLRGLSMEGRARRVTADLPGLGAGE